MARTGKNARDIFSTDIFADTSQKSAGRKATSRSAPKKGQGTDAARGAGRPPVHDEEWERVTVVLFKRQTVALDRLALDIRAHVGAPISRAEIIRALVEALLASKIDSTALASIEDLHARLTVKLGK